MRTALLKPEIARPRPRNRGSGGGAKQKSIETWGGGFDLWLTL